MEQASLEPTPTGAPGSSPAGISAQGVGVTFPPHQPALRNIHLHIAAGEFVSLVGPSGCGKSTLLRLIAGLLTPTEGQLSVAGAPAHLARRDHRVGFVFQDPTLLPWRNVVENIRLPLELQGVGRPDSQPAVDRSLALIGLAAEDRRKYPRMLSGGMRMRVSLARALAAEPQVLLLDEPFAALDDMLRQQLNEDLADIWAERKFTAVFVTHNVSEAVFLSQRVLVMGPRPGTIVAEFPSPFPYPRTFPLRAHPAFAELAGQIGARLRAAFRATGTNDEPRMNADER